MKAQMLLIAAVALGACTTGAQYQPIVDGGKAPRYSADLNACQTLAQERGYFNADTMLDTAIGAGLAALAGAGDSDAGIGAIVGGVAGMGSGAYKAEGQRREIVIDCMRGRDHRVVG